MTITEGHYRGAHCTVTLIPDTAQVVVSVDYANHEDNVKKFLDYVGENFVLKALGVPDNYKECELTFSIRDDEFVKGFCWMFPTRMIDVHSTQWGFIMHICKAIDKISEFVMECKDGKVGKILFRKGSRIVMNYENNNLSIKHVDGPDHPWRHDPYTFKDIKALAGGESYLSSGEFILLDDLREDFFVDKDGGHDFDTIISEKFMKILSRPQD